MQALSNRGTKLSDGRREFIESFLEASWIPAWQTHDGELLQRCFHRGGTYSDPFFGTVHRGRLPWMLRRLAALVDTLDFSVVERPAISDTDAGEENMVALQWLMTGFLPIVGTPLRLPGCDFLRIRGDRIIEARTYFDLATFAQQTAIDSLSALLTLRLVR